jgi:NitT/TauT family transport system substrate-binding protein
MRLAGIFWQRWAKGGRWRLPRPLACAGLGLLVAGAGCVAGGQPATSKPGGPPAVSGAPPVPASGSQGGAPAAPATGGQVGLPTASPAPLRLVVNYSAINGAQSPLWTAYEAGYYREQGLDVELTAVNNTPRVLQAMVAGEIHLSTIDPSSAVQASLEGADFVLLFAAANRLIFSVLGQPDLHDPQALRGKVLGITRIGSAAHTAGKVALKGWGLAPDRDVALLQLGEASAILAGLEARQVDAGVLSAPTSSRARLSGFAELVNLNTQGPEYPSVAVGAPRSWVSGNEEAVRRFGRAYAQAIHRFKTDRAYALDVFRKYAKLEDPQLLDDTYAQFSPSFEDVPYVSEVGLAAMLEDLVGEDPRLAGRQASDWIDSRFVRDLESSGYIRQLASGSP